MQEFNEGDLAEAVKGESVVRGRVKIGTRANGVEGYKYLGDSAAIKEVYIHDGWTVTVIDKAAPTLPTEPGSVISWVTEFYTGLAVLEKTDQWCYDGVTLNSVALEREIDGHPIVPLESVPVTAKKVIDWIDKWEDSRDAWSRDDMVKEAYAEFGITE